jgi:deoxyadenosine/deoxycytidine kinase
MSVAEAPGFIIVEGPIGVGKTSLARRLAQTFGGELLLERAEDNPFLERYYQNPRPMALPTQLSFLFQRVQQIQALRQGDLFRPKVISDFLLEKDPLFARLTLDDDELRLYEQVYRHLDLQPPAPDLVIYLQAPVETLIERVRKRGVPYERWIESAYLQRLADAYADFFYHYDQSPLLIVNAAAIDWVGNERDYLQLVDYIRATRSGRHYLNPLPAELLA